MVDEETFLDFRFQLENIAKRQQFHRTLTGKHKDLKTLESTLSDPNDIALLRLQATHLIKVWDKKLKTVKGMELARKNKTDPIKVWHDHLIHQKGLDASLTMASKIVYELFMLRSKSFPTKAEFLSAYDDKLYSSRDQPKILMVLLKINRKFFTKSLR